MILKNMICGSPLESSWVQNCAPNRPSGNKKITNRDAGRILLALPAQTGDAKAAQCARGFHFHDIDVIFTDLPSILVPIVASNRNKQSKTAKNLQKYI